MLRNLQFLFKKIRKIIRIDDDVATLRVKMQEEATQKASEYA